MNEKSQKKYPKTIAGLYEVDFDNLVLTAIALPNSEPCDHRLIDIRFECGIGNARFDNGFVATLNVKYNEIDNCYTFKFRDSPHIFEIKANLGGLCSTVDIMSLIDFGELSKEDQSL